MTPDIHLVPKTTLPAAHPDVDELGNAMIHALSAPDFAGLPIPQQIAWILHTFQTCITRGLKELAVIRSLIQLHAARLYADPALKLADACILTEAIHGMNWGDAASLFDMRDYDRYGVQPFRHYVRTHTSTTVSEKKCVGKQKKLKIAYFIHYADTNRGNALGPLIRSIVLSHARLGEAEIVCYCVQWCDQAFVDVMAERGICLRVIPQELSFSRLEELRLAILKDAPDVVISDVASPIASWLFIHRVAPLQMYLDPGYPHWNLPELDWVLLPGKVYQRGFELPSERWSTMRMALNEKALDMPANRLASRQRVATDVIYFGAFTRLIKITDAWLAAVESLLIQQPQARLLIVGSGNPIMVRRLADSYADRVSIINEMVDLKTYQSRIDVLLDTFPFIGGLVCREFMGYGIPVVSVLSGEWDEMLRDQRDPVLLAQSSDEFVRIADRLATDPEFYKLASAASISMAAKQNQPSYMIQDIEDGIRLAMHYHENI
jgi:glycosyltransferase involved in cell wall biosynthesis